MHAVSAKDLDVVVFGATGVTGRRVAAYLASRGDGSLKWAAAARDPAKAARVLAEDGVTAPETIAADVGDLASLAAMASRSKVVLNLVGPYAKYGRPVIEACVAGGAHYADLTGEMSFARRVIEEFDALAVAAGVKIVQPCGFESLPPDLAVRLAAETARERYGEGLESVDLEVSFRPPPGRPRPSDGISGGTFQSLVTALGDDDPATTLDPAALIVDPGVAASVRRASPIRLVPRRSATGAVLTPMIPVAYINPAVVHRSATGAGETPFRYREGVAIPGSPLLLPVRFGVAGLLAGVQAGMKVGLSAGPGTRARIARGLDRIGPASGFGPRPDRLEGWVYTLAVQARTAGGHSVGVTAVGHGHPGYLSTARMLGEAGVMLASGEDVPDRAGALTPSLALGTTALGQFARAQLTFTVD